MPSLTKDPTCAGWRLEVSPEMSDIDWQKRGAGRQRELAGTPCASDLDSLSERISSSWIPVSERLPPLLTCEGEIDGMREASAPVLVRLANARQVTELGRYRVAIYYRSSLDLKSYDVFDDPDGLTFEDDHAWYDGWEDVVEDIPGLVPDVWFPLPVNPGEAPQEPESSEYREEYDREATGRLIRQLIEKDKLLQIPQGRPRGSKTRRVESDGYTISVTISSSELPRKDDIEWLRELAEGSDSVVPEGLLLEQELARGGTRETLRARVRRCCVSVSVHFEGKGIGIAQSLHQIFEAWRIRNPHDPGDPHAWSTESGWADVAPWDNDPNLAGIWFNRSLLDHFLAQQST